MKEKFVYDLPTRVFHWLFAILFVVAFSIGSYVDDDSSIFSYHMMAGMTLFLLVVLRLFWGIVGTTYAKFSGFSLAPMEVINYFRGILTGDKRKWSGHNPASSWAAIIMMIIAIGLGVTGYMMISGWGGHDIKEVHELLANGFLVIVLLHIAGVALHSLRHRDAIWKSVFSGNKSDVPDNGIIIKPYRATGTILLLGTLLFSAYLFKNFDSKTRNLALFGSKFHLGEAEGKRRGKKKLENNLQSKIDKSNHDDDD